MPLSTSSSNQRLPHASWGSVLMGALAIFATFVIAMELSLAARGFRSTVIDSEALWLKQRHRASDLGARGLILVGDSRMELDVDLDVLRRCTGLAPVQLALDHSSFIPVLRSLADDPSVAGTIIVSFSESAMMAFPHCDTADRLEIAYKQERARRIIPDFTRTETYLTDFIHYHLRSYADGARPMTSLFQRILNPNATPQYITILPDRSKLADYTKIEQQQLYYKRVLSTLGEQAPSEPGMTFNDFKLILQDKIDALKPADSAAYLGRIGGIVKMAHTIEARGGRVFFVMMPRSGYVRQIEDHRFPRQAFWDRFAESLPGHTLHFEDVPGLRDMVCPDGSHLDYRDREHFTRTLVSALGLDH